MKTRLRLPSAFSLPDPPPTRFKSSPAVRLGLLLGMAIGLVATGHARAEATTAASGQERSAKPAPAFTLPTHSGTTVVSDSLRGKVVLVDFWASWCDPCKQSFPWMSQLQTRYREKGLAVVAINLDKSRDAADVFLVDRTVPFVVAYDPSGKTAEEFGVKAMPTSFLLDRQGRILYRHTGFDPRKAGAFENLIAEACTP